MRIFFVVVFICLLLPNYILANTVVRSGEIVTISDDQLVDGDFYGLGGTVAISGKASEDLLLIGGNVTVNGEIGGDLSIVGGTVDIHGTVKDDVRIIGGTVVIAGDVIGNLVVVASDLKVLSTATIGGDLLFFGGVTDISGTIDNNILGTSEKMRIDGKVGGVDVKTSNLVLGSRADITNNISYNSTHELIRAQEAKVTGKIIYNEFSHTANNNVRSAVIVFLIFLFAALVSHLFLKPFTYKVVNSLESQTLRYFGIGFGVFFLVPIAGVILLVSTLGSIVGLLLLAGYLVLLSLTFALIGVIAGSYVMRLTKHTNTTSVLTIVVGVAVVNLLFYIPLIGPSILIGLFILTIGIIAEKINQLLRN